MPHVIVELYAGRSESDKKALAARITKAVMDTLNAVNESVSVAIEDVDPKDWLEKVYRPDIETKADFTRNQDTILTPDRIARGKDGSAYITPSGTISLASR